MKPPISKIKITLHAVVVLIAIPTAPSSMAAGRIDLATLVSTSQGTFNKVQYTRYEAMFEGVTQNNRPYRVPCQIVAPSDPARGNHLLLFDWLVPSTIVTAVGQEQADARYIMKDEFLFGTGLCYATVRCNPAGIGKRSPLVDSTRPWSDGLLDTSSEFISSPGDEYDIVVDYVKALGSDPIAVGILGNITRTAAFSYSAGGIRLRGLLRIPAGKGLFNFTLIGGVGSGFDRPSGNRVGFSSSESAPPPGAGLEIDLRSETEVVDGAGAEKARHEESNYRSYEFAGTAHLRNVDVAEFGLPDPERANPAEWTPFFRALFVAAYNWCDGIAPPPTVWLGAPNKPEITRDSKGNALVRYVGGLPVNTTEYRLPEVAIGENQYIPLDLSYDDGTFLGLFRMIAGGHIDLTDTFTDHNAYVEQVATQARALEGQGYLLKTDADAIILRAIQSDIGR